MVRKLILSVALGVAVLGACGKSASPGDEFVGHWSDGTKGPVVISRAGGGFDITKAGDDFALHGKYENGTIRVTQNNRTVVFTYDKKRDLVDFTIGGFPLAELKRLK